MTQQSITVADALVRLKTTKARIETAKQAQFIAVRQAGRIPGALNAAIFERDARAAMDSITALLRNYAALKGALVQSNATTSLTIGGQTMTVAAAIERKTSIEQDRTILAQFTQEHAQARRALDQMNAHVVQQADAQAVAFFGNKADKTAKDYTDFVQQYIARNGADLIDPLGLGDIIARWGRDIQDFLANVVLALTTSNVMTTVVVDLM